VQSRFNSGYDAVFGKMYWWKRDKSRLYKILFKRKPLPFNESGLIFIIILDYLNTEILIFAAGIFSLPDIWKVYNPLARSATFNWKVLE
jgi:hypothetical protein